MADFDEKLNQILSSPEAMEQIAALANSIAGKPDAPSPQTPAGAQTAPPEGNVSALLGDLDSEMLSRLSTLMAEYTAQGDEKQQLLTAMKPFLSVQRQERLSAALRITRLSRVIHAALGMLKGDEREHV